MKSQLDLPQTVWFQFWLNIGLRRASKKFENQAYQQGMGRHSIEEVNTMGMDDLQALSDFLGDKKYLMGDKPTEVDCSMFGLLVISFYAPITSDSTEQVLKDFPRLRLYVERMKAEFFPDWSRLLSYDLTQIM